MPDNPQVHSNAVSDQSTDNVEGSLGRLNIHEKQEKDGVDQSNPYPDRPGEPDCLYYLRTGSCAYGSNCRFNHPASAAQGALYYREELPERVGQPDCEYFLKTGTCKYGSTCKYHHPKDRNGAGPVLFNILGLPMRQDEKSCPYYMRNGSCKFGSTCKFHHPQPTSYNTAIPINVSAAYGSSILPSPGVPYVGGFPTWSLPRAPYVTGPRLQAPQGYMPVAVTPHGMLPVPGLNTYLQPDTNSTTQQHLNASSSLNLPERTDKPECRYYMNTGTCKYGSDCKYNHPKERCTQFSSNTMLPSRPGQAVCSNYITYGACKFGAACRFDHPLLGYPYTYGLSLPHLSTFDSSSYITYPRISSITNSSDASPLIPAKGSESTTDGDIPKRGNENSGLKKSSDASEQAESDAW